MYKIYISPESLLLEELLSTFNKNNKLTNDIFEADIIFSDTNYPAKSKKKELKHIEKFSNEEAVIFTSSVCLPVSEQSLFSKNPSRLVGIGLYKSFSKAKLIEISFSKIVNKKIALNAEKFLKSCELQYSIVPDKTGLVFPRIISMIINEAAQLYSENIASKEDIDTAMKLGTNYPFGPLEWADKIGIGLIYDILYSLHKDFGEDRYRPHPLLKEMKNLNLKFYQ